MTDIAQLIHKYLKEELSEEESQQLQDWQQQSERNRRIFNRLTDDEYLLQAVTDHYKIDSDEVALQKINARIDADGQAKNANGKTGMRTKWFRLSVAAAILLVLATSAVYILQRSKADKEVTTTAPEKRSMQQDLLPGGNKAILTLSNGQKISLDSAANGNLATQGKTAIVKTADGQLAYDAKVATTDVFYNTVSTPKGGQYQLTLSDGTRIWMNAASILRFPTAFTGNERLVELDGEAYFEVTKNAHKPFIVKSKNGMTVQVLGTHFNVMAYAEEQDTKATLLEGLVKVTNGASVAVLKPGQQALSATSNNNDPVRINKDADTEEAIAWKNGIFQFNNTDLKAVMRQIARWYNVEVSYDDRVSEKRFTGRISRNLKASELLSGIEYVGVHFKIDGNKIIVLP